MIISHAVIAKICIPYYHMKRLFWITVVGTSKIRHNYNVYGHRNNLLQSVGYIVNTSDAIKNVHTK